MSDPVEHHVPLFSAVLTGLYTPLVVLAIELPPDEIADAKWRIRHFSSEWFGETPMRLHARELGPDGSPRFSGEFEGYLSDSEGDRGQSRRFTLADNPRSRVLKAFRQLRRKAPREFDVLYCMCVLDQVGRGLKQSDSEGLADEFEASLRRTTQRLNERGGRWGNVALTENEIMILVLSGLRKIVLWAG